MRRITISNSTQLSFLLIVMLTQVFSDSTLSLAQSWDWVGEFDGSRDPRRIITSGKDILTVERAYVWDNGEGEQPDGTGSDWSWYGWRHGPYGGFRMFISDAKNGQELKRLWLHGPHAQGKKWEWCDDEGLVYKNFGIYDWKAHECERIRIEIFESDPGPYRMHDVLITMEIGREESRHGISFSNEHFSLLELRTVDLPTKIAGTSEN